MLFTVLKYVLIALMGAGVITILVFALKTRKPIRALFASGAGGIAALFAISLFSGLTGVSLAVNLWSVGCAFITGIPGVVLMLVMKMIWGF